MTNDPSANRIKREPTRAEQLEEPLPVDRTVPPNPEPSSESQRVEQELDERLAKYKRGGA